MGISFEGVRLELEVLSAAEYAALSLDEKSEYLERIISNLEGVVRELRTHQRYVKRLSKLLKVTD